MSEVIALPNPENSILIQKHLLGSRNVHSEMPWDRKNWFLHWKCVLAPDKHKQAWLG